MTLGKHSRRPRGVKGAEEKEDEVAGKGKVAKDGVSVEYAESPGETEAKGDATLSNAARWNLTLCDEGCTQKLGRCVCLRELKALPSRERHRQLGSPLTSETPPDSNNGVVDDFLHGWPQPLSAGLRELGEQVFSAVASGDYERLNEVVDECESKQLDLGCSILNVRRASKGSDFPLSLAASLDDVEMMQLLVDRGCCLKCQTVTNESALHVAALLGRVGAVRFLLKQGADVFLFTCGIQDRPLVDEVIHELVMELEGLSRGDTDDVGEFATNLETVVRLILHAGSQPSLDILEMLRRTAEGLPQGSSARILAEGISKLAKLHARPPSQVATKAVLRKGITLKRQDEPATQVLSSSKSPAGAAFPLRKPKGRHLEVEIPLDSLDSLASPPSSASPRKRFINNHRVLVVSPGKKLQPPSSGADLPPGLH